MKNFVKALNQDDNDFKYFKEIVPRLSDAKLKGNIFIAPEIKKISGDLVLKKNVKKFNWKLAALKKVFSVVIGVLCTRKWKL